MNFKNLAYMSAVGLFSQVALAVPPSVAPFKTSQIYVDKVTDQAGTGRPKFENGLDLKEIATPAGLAGYLRIYTKTDHLPYYKADNGAETKLLSNPASLTSEVTGILPAANGGTGVNSTATYPSSGTVVTRTATETLTNKTLTAPTVNQPLFDGADASRYMDVTENTTSPSAPSAGNLRVYGKTDDSLYFQNSAGTESQVGSGSGEKNYVQTGASTAAGWTASGAGITVATSTTTADLPRPNTTRTGIKFTGVSGSTAFAYYDFTLDDADYNKKLKLQFEQKPQSTYVASDMKVDVYSCTIAWSSGTCGGTSARLALSTDVSAVTALSTLTGTFRAAFDSPGSAAKFLQLQVGLNTTSTKYLLLSDIVVGPGVIVQGAAMSSAQTFTMTVGALTTAPTKGTVQKDLAMWWREGEFMHISWSYRQSAGGSSGTGQYGFAIPAGYTIDSSYYDNSGSSGATAVGSFQVLAGSTGYVGTVGIDLNDTFNGISGTNNLTLHGGYNASGISIGSTTSGFSGDLRMSLIAKVKIAQWAGSGTVNVVQNDCEYVYNSDTANSNNTSAFAYGPDGVAIGSYTGGITKRVRFLSSVQATDKVTLELKNATNAVWNELSSADFQTGIQPLAYQSATAYGVGINLGGVSSSTDVDVAFGQYAYPSSGTYAGAGSAWSGFAASWKWRVKKCAGGQAVGFGSATTTQAGLVDTTTQSFTGIKSWTGNPSVQAFQNNSQTAVASGTTTAIAYDAETYDVTSSYAPGVAATPTAGTFTAPVAGKYLVTASLALNNGTGVLSSATFKVKKNGSDHASLWKNTFGTAFTDFVIGGSTVISLAAGDTVTFSVTASTTGGAGNWFVASDSSSHMNIEKIQ